MKNILCLKREYVNEYAFCGAQLCGWRRVVWKCDVLKKCELLQM